MAAKDKSKKKQTLTQEPVIPKEKPANTLIKNMKIGIFIFGFLLYANTINHLYVLDDVAIIEANFVTKEGLKGIGTHLTHGYWYGFNMSNDFVYRPLAPITFAIEYEFFEQDPTVSHFINVVLYAISGVILFSMLLLLLSNYNYVLPLIISLLYVAHPIHTEAVANVKSRDEILAFLFGMSAIYFILKSFHQSSKGPEMKYTVFSFVCFFLAMLSKESAITLAGVVPFLIYFLKKKDVNKSILSTVPFIIAAIVYLVMRGAFLESLTGSEIDVKSNTLATATSYLDQLATVIYVLGRYVFILLLPYQLTHDYSYNQLPVTNWANPLAIISLLFYIGVLYFTVKAVIRKFSGKDSGHKDILTFGILYFLITISIVSNLFLLIGAVLAERFLYSPSLGFCIVLGVSLVMIFKTDLHDKKIQLQKNTGLMAVLTVILVGYSYKTITRAGEWKDNYTLFSTDIITSPNSARVHNALSSVLVVKAKSEEEVEAKDEMLETAIKAANRAIEIYPKYRDAHYNLGTAHGIKGENEKALEILNKTIALDSTYNNGYYNLGVIYNTVKNYPNAIRNLTKAIKYDPGNLQIYHTLANAYKSNGQLNNAIKAYNRGLKYDPNDKVCLTNIARSYIESGNLDAAIPHLKKLTSVDPGNVDGFYNLGIIYVQKGEPKIAEQYLQKAYELKPELKKHRLN